MDFIKIMIRVYKEYSRYRKLIGVGRNYVLRGDEGYLMNVEFIEKPNHIVIIEYDDETKEEWNRKTEMPVVINTPIINTDLGVSLEKVLFTRVFYR